MDQQVQLVQATTCANCGASIYPGEQYCRNCGRPAAPLATMSGSYSGSDPLLTWEVEYPESLSRWKIFVKIFLAIPQYFALWLLGMAASIVTIIAWFAILFTGRYPRGLFDFMLMYMRWNANVQAYVMLQRDEYPPFGEDPYPAHMNLQYADHLSRWKIFLKWLLIIPSSFVWAFVAMAMLFAVVICWFVILIMGRMPRGLFDFITGTYQWGYRINAYSYLMTDKYPPFSLD